MTPIETAHPLAPLRDALAAAVAHTATIGVERVALADARGRALAQDIIADRPSPPVDVSAMDGIALRAADADALIDPGLPIAGEARIGGPVPTLPAASAMWVFTGGPVPRGADAIVVREDLDPSSPLARRRAVLPTAPIRPGQHIRRAGENARPGDTALHAGAILSPPVIGMLAGMGQTHPVVRRRVRVAVAVTGDELCPSDRTPTPTGLRDTNGPAIAALLRSRPWIELVECRMVPDVPAEIASIIRRQMPRADCIATTGGVSMGDHDHVPPVVEQLGGVPIFHRLAIKPGKPIYCAALPNGPLLVGLPGNPVSAMVTARRILLPILAAIGGIPHDAVGPDSRLDIGGDHAIGPSELTRFPLVARNGLTGATLVPSRGSGDAIAASRSDGFVELPAGKRLDDPVDFYAWSPA